jgi:hypothetical protein
MTNDSAYYLTAHVDLEATQLEDFIEHMEQEIWSIGMLGLLDFGRATGQWKREDWKPFPHEKNSNIRIAQHNFESDDAKNSIAISVVKRGNTSCWWSACYPGQGFSPNRPIAPGKSDFRLEATHYRYDRLNVVMWESPNIEPVLGDYLLAWLKQYWRDGVEDLRERGEQDPKPPKKEKAPLLPRRASNEQWNAWFDWYYRQPWGDTHSIEHMAKQSGKSKSTVGTMHANYQAGNR